MSRSFKTDAIVLRSIRYGEADRILHLFTPARGRIGAIAKGVRKATSRFGGRLEPYFRLELILHEGRGELMTVSAAETIEPHARLREHGAALTAAGSASEAVLGLFDTDDPNPPAYNLLANYLFALDRDAELAGRASGLAFRAKLLVAAGFAPELAACANCGSRDDLVAFSPAAGGVTCRECAEGFAFSAAAHAFLSGVLAEPLTQPPVAGQEAMREAQRAISETIEFHANVRLRTVA